MDHVSGTNKKMFLWIEGGGSSCLRIKKEGSSPTPTLPPTHLLVLEGASRASKTIKAGSALSGGEVCLGKPAGMAKPFH